VQIQSEKGGFKPGVKGEGINSSWMEDSNGNRVHKDRQDQILGAARKTWRTMESFEVGMASYTSVPGPVLNYFRAKMESMFEELRFCADHWKTDAIWKENFSSTGLRRARPSRSKKKVDQQGPPPEGTGGSSEDANRSPGDQSKPSDDLGHGDLPNEVS